jgi:integrase
VKGDKFPPHPLTIDEARALIDAAGSGRAGARNRALVTLGYRAGLRCSEALALQVEDLEPKGDGLVVRVRKPKGYRTMARPRYVGLSPKAAAIVREWIEMCRGPLVFTTRTGEPMLPSYVRQLMVRLGKRAGLRKRVHFHGLRHTFARHLYDEGVGTVHIQHALGHRSLSMTERYLSSVGSSEVLDVTLNRGDNW